MTKEEAREIIKKHKREKEYSASCLQVGEVKVLLAFENGFTFERKTEYIEAYGIYEEIYKTSDIFDNNAYNIAEVVTKRLN